MFRLLYELLCLESMKTAVVHLSNLVFLMKRMTIEGSVENKHA